MTNLQAQYNEWLKISLEMLKDGFGGSTDCGRSEVREDFSNFADLKETITYEQMLELENK